MELLRQAFLPRPDNFTFLSVSLSLHRPRSLIDFFSFEATRVRWRNFLCVPPDQKSILIRFFCAKEKEGDRDRKIFGNNKTFSVCIIVDGRVWKKKRSGSDHVINCFNSWRKGIIFKCHVFERKIFARFKLIKKFQCAE